MTLERKTSGGIALALVAVFLVAGWWPFERHPPNRVGWLTGRPGLHFRPNAIAVDTAARPFGATGEATDAGFTLELWLEAERVSDDDCAHILTVHDGRMPSNLVLCQWQSELILRVRSAAGSVMEVGSPSALRVRQRRFVTVVADAHGTSFYLDGAPAGHFPSFMVPAGILEGRLLLGDSAVGKQGWTGNLMGLAIFDRALGAEEVARDYREWTGGESDRIRQASGVAALFTFDEHQGHDSYDAIARRHLSFPPDYGVVEKRWLARPWEPGRFESLGAGDLVLNVLGFVPFGFFCCRFWRMGSPGQRVRHGLLTIAIGASISLLIEIVQAWLPERDSSLTDFVLNTLGTAIGAMLS